MLLQEQEWVAIDKVLNPGVWKFLRSEKPSEILIITEQQPTVKRSYSSRPSFGPLSSAGGTGPIAKLFHSSKSSADLKLRKSRLSTASESFIAKGKLIVKKREKEQRLQLVASPIQLLKTDSVPRWAHTRTESASASMLVMDTSGERADNA